MNEALAGLVIAGRTQEAGSRGAAMAVALLGATARLDLVSHPHPFLEPRLVVADTALERASDAMHFVDLDAHPRRRRKANQEPHGPAIVVAKIQESEVAFAADHGCFLKPASRPGSSLDASAGADRRENPCARAGCSDCPTSGDRRDAIDARRRIRGVPDDRIGTPTARRFRREAFLRCAPSSAG